MKKYLSIILAAALAALSAGCSTGSVTEELSAFAPSAIVSDNNEVTPVTTAAPTTEEPTTEAPETTSAGDSTAPTDAGAKTVRLSDLTSIADNPRSTDKLTDNYGNTYGEAFINSSTYYEYLLDGKYSSLKGTLYIPKGESSNSDINLTVKGDGYVLYASPLMTKTSGPVDFEVNISGFNKLAIEWNKNGYKISCCLANGVLSQEEAPGQETVDRKTLPREITDLTSISDKPKKSDRLTDVHENTYNYAIYNTIGGNGCFEYLLDKKYGKFAGTLYFPTGENSSDSITMTLTADGETIYESPAMTVSSAPVDFEVDISQCNDFKISFSKNSYRGCLCVGNAYIYDA